MKLSKKKIVVLVAAAASVLVALAATFLALGLTVWQPDKATQDWLNDFSASLKIEESQDDQKIERTILISENGKEAARYYQLVEVKKQDGITVAHLVVEETFPNLATTEYNIKDEYFYYNKTLYLQRQSGEDVIETKQKADWKVFWAIAIENIQETAYNFDEKNFTQHEINHNDNIHSLSATIANDRQKEFFGNQAISDITDIVLAISIGENKELIRFDMNCTYKNNQYTAIAINISEPKQIEIKEFAKE